jgi:antitoxin (DNA-binding transcriptional repressor) of toxin-antitoxin stability system
MQSVAIRDLKNNPSNMTKHLENGESVFVTKHGKPVGITLPLNDDVFSLGVKKAVAVELYKMGVVSLGKMAEILEIKKQEAMALLNSAEINWLEDDTDTITKETKQWL